MNEIYQVNLTYRGIILKYLEFNNLIDKLINQISTSNVKKSRKILSRTYDGKWNYKLRYYYTSMYYLNGILLHKEDKINDINYSHNQIDSQNDQTILISKKENITKEDFYNLIPTLSLNALNLIIQNLNISREDLYSFYQEYQSNYTGEKSTYVPILK